MLGYADDRERILAVIADRLLRQRVHELPGGRRHPYATLAEALFAEVTAIIECISKGIDFPSTLIGPSQASIGYVIYISFLLARE
ncbi:hypothetical protein JOC55_002200 [Paenibacillus sacheonensis]|nr:hypothetical protein [Paenibacillus sacheonensis]